MPELQADLRRENTPLWVPDTVVETLPLWYAVYTRSNFEKRVAADLVAKRIENYLPLVEELHHWKDRKKVVEVPVFPGYVFARFVDSQRNRLSVLRSIGTVRILGQEERIEPVPDVEIDSIRRLLKSNLPCFAHPFLRQGAWVKVKRGPLKDLEGLLVRVKSKTRLVLSITLLSQSVATEIDILDVEVLRRADRPHGPGRKVHEEP
ncbi:MAG: UpxY family transcription antiterminator [Acidobacteria bacterium]|nr:UpxY family transcription antiterminator [Acidobacteriota bacterium]